jgi:hypothetical protein
MIAKSDILRRKQIHSIKSPICHPHRSIFASALHNRGQRVVDDAMVFVSRVRSPGRPTLSNNSLDGLSFDHVKTPPRELTTCQTSRLDAEQTSLRSRVMDIHKNRRMTTVGIEMTCLFRCSEADQKRVLLIMTFHEID